MTRMTTLMASAALTAALAIATTSAPAFASDKTQAAFASYAIVQQAPAIQAAMYYGADQMKLGHIAIVADGIAAKNWVTAAAFFDDGTGNTDQQKVAIDGGTYALPASATASFVATMKAPAPRLADQLRAVAYINNAKAPASVAG